MKNAKIIFMLAANTELFLSYGIHLGEREGQIVWYDHNGHAISRMDLIVEGSFEPDGEVYLEGVYLNPDGREDKYHGVAEDISELVKGTLLQDWDDEVSGDPNIEW